STLLFTVTGRSATDVYAIGGLGGAELIHWDGTAWSQIELPPFAPTAQGVWTAPGQPLYVAGWEGFTAALGEQGEWTIERTDTGLGYHAVFGDGGGSAWAVGGDIYSQLDDHQGIIISTREGVPAPP